jgi:hypothetical protein
MRYWKFKKTNRVIKVDVQMNPDNWIEITKEEFETLRGVN